ncbi:glycosyltransferase family 4 protein [Duganella violaceipulchra]|uniref:Glycosyltransferase family 4 protein n=1 Tax=Duganella violaceipulchra TaxID=2849652 RepID=A0AA41KZ97_9BURK|nr:glycosyltransferase family 4 protein [Duganella violaceicalia]MBV6319946.1 glycosyltransferase family 4 protein [Duganella violaceicalia]MCP2010310.1 glycosyltransferase involved in cell wall biosynthesis [Duganella violaceicalia]
MVGTSFQAQGGITSVVRSYVDYGIFDAWGINYVVTYEKSAKLTQVRVMCAALWRIFWLLALGRVSLVHMHSASRGSFWRKSLVAGMAWLFRVPYVFHIHSGEFPVFYGECGPRGQAWIRWVLRHAGRVVALTGHWQRTIQAIEPAARIALVGNPVHVPGALAPLREPAKTVLFLGRMQLKKGIFDLVNAIPAVLAAVPDAHFVLAGDGELAAAKQRVAELGVGHAVEFTGWVDGVKKQALLERADLFVLPSYFEALPVGLLEAMSSGIPIVSTAVGGIPDFIGHEVDGMLVTPGAVAPLAAAMVALLGDAGMRGRLREHAFGRVGREYSFAAVMAQLQQIYVELGEPVGAIVPKRA